MALTFYNSDPLVSACLRWIEARVNDLVERDWAYIEAVANKLLANGSLDYLEALGCITAVEGQANLVVETRHLAPTTKRQKLME